MLRLEFENPIERVILSPISVENPATHQGGDATALWDTGANTSAIRRDVIEGLDLKSIRTTQTSSVLGQWVSGVYLCHIELPDGSGVDIPVLEAPNLDIAHIIIGMDIISLGEFSLFHREDGCLTFTFELRKK